VSKTFAPVVSISVANKIVTVAPTEDEQSFWPRQCTAPFVSIIAGMVKGVSEGYSKELEIQGVGSGQPQG